MKKSVQNPRNIIQLILWKSRKFSDKSQILNVKKEEWWLLRNEGIF